jgi:hypothetical protein
MAQAKQDIQGYLESLKEKQAILEDLLLHYNDGKSKGFYCLAVNLLPLTALREIWSEIEATETLVSMNQKEKANQVMDLLKAAASKLQIELTLRK